MAELKEGILKLLKNYGMTDNKAEEYYKKQVKEIKKVVVKEHVEQLKQECVDVLDEINKTGEIPELIF
jgi:hypothetical protein|nr:MAG TPA: hypothetical protein [Caudoviricetes sp.]